MDSDDTVKTVSEYKTVLVRMRPADVKKLDQYRIELEQANDLKFTRSDALHMLLLKSPWR